MTVDRNFDFIAKPCLRQLNLLAHFHMLPLFLHVPLHVVKLFSHTFLSVNGLQPKRCGVQIAEGAKRLFSKMSRLSLRPTRSPT